MKMEVTHMAFVTLLFEIMVTFILFFFFFLEKWVLVPRTIQRTAVKSKHV